MIISYLSILIEFIIFKFWFKASPLLWFLFNETRVSCQNFEKNYRIIISLWTHSLAVKSQKSRFSIKYTVFVIPVKVENKNLHKWMVHCSDIINTKQ